MNAMKKKIMLYIPTVLLGLVATYLQSEVLANGFDEKGLLILNNPSLLEQPPETVNLDEGHEVIVPTQS